MKIKGKTTGFAQIGAGFQLLFILYGMTIYVVVDKFSVLYQYSCIFTTFIFVVQLLVNDINRHRNYHLKDVVFDLPIHVAGIFFILIEIFYVIILNNIHYTNLESVVKLQIMTICVYLLIILTSFNKTKREMHQVLENTKYSLKNQKRSTTVIKDIDELSSKVLEKQLEEMITKRNNISTKSAVEIERLIYNKIQLLDKKVETSQDINEIKKEVKELILLYEEKKRICNIL